VLVFSAINQQIIERWPLIHHPGRHLRRNYFPPFNVSPCGNI